MWSLPEIYGAVTSKKDPRSNAIVFYKGIQYSAWVTTAPHGRKSPAFRLWFDPILSLALKRTFLLSYMRSMEGALQEKVDIEQLIPFWEFLDIEFDKQRHAFRFVAYYRQQASFHICSNALSDHPHSERWLTKSSARQRRGFISKTGNLAR